MRFVDLHRKGGDGRVRASFAPLPGAEPGATLKALPAQPSSIVIEITAFWTCGASIGLITGS